ncbi:MAG: hypothetical protein DLM61_13785 [Pseudonocardiales bacterium]|nr:MAG: hypothetical protein DLM61_13785 [Pseudonocardiales bacterium]
MTGANTAVFWSYAHEDDRLDGGRLLLLAEHLKQEYSLITGETLEIFVDRDAIEWGDEWRSRIDTALVQTAFFVPIITPRYFTRVECREELLAFYREATSWGLTQLVMPILYAIVPNFSEDNSDELIALISRMQHTSWSDLRLTAVDSVEYRRAVNSLARRLASLTTSVVEMQLASERSSFERDGHPELIETVEEINSLLPEWLNAVQLDPVYRAQYRVTSEAHRSRIQKLEDSRGPASALFLAIQKFGNDQLPIAEKHLKLAKIYSAKTIALDPLMAAAFRAANANKEVIAFLDELRGAVKEAVVEIAASAHRFSNPQTVRAADFAKRYIHNSRTWRKISEMHETADKYVSETNEVVLRWDSELDKLGAGTTT